MDAPRTSFEYGRLGGTSGFRVLVADDHPTNRRLFNAIFGSCGCSVTVAEDGAEAIALALSQDFDLICLDRHMPHLSGDEVAERLCSQAGPRPFLVLCTSDPRPHEGPNWFNAELTKPVRPQEVVDVIVEALRFRRSRPRGGGDRARAVEGSAAGRAEAS